LSYFNFDKFITPSIIKWIWVIGAVIITLMGLAVATTPTGYYAPKWENNLYGSIIIVLGNVFWRILCEAQMVQYKIYGALDYIEKNMRSLDKDVP
jgi:hypothetical protein